MFSRFIQKKNPIVFILTCLAILGCEVKSQKQKSETVKKPQTSVSQTSPKPKQDWPYYKEVHQASDAVLEEISYSNMDELTAINIIINSCNEIKADFMNYSLDIHKIETPEDIDREPSFEAEHIGHFITWMYLKKETKCFPAIFQAMEVIFASEAFKARDLIIAGSFEVMYKEGRKYGVNFYDAYDEWLQPNTKQTWDFMMSEWDGNL